MTWRVWRLLLIIIRLDNQSDDCGNDHAELKQSFPCNHNHHPLSCDRGQRSITPEKIEGNRLPGCYWQHHRQHNTPCARLQENSPGRDSSPAGLSFMHWCGSTHGITESGFPLTDHQENCNKIPPGRGNLSGGVSFSRRKQALFPNPAGFFR